MLTKKPSSLKEEMNMELLKALKEFFSPKRVLLISAKKKIGFEEVLTLLYEIKCACGDLM